MESPLIFHRYRRVRPIGHGASGSIYEAEDVETGARVALKACGPVKNKPQALGEVFRRLKQLTHPNLVRVHDAGVEGGTIYVVMELLEGVPLSEWLRSRGPLVRQEAVALFRQVASAVKALHTAGLIHGDLKPENLVLLANGHVKLVDFGLARLVNWEGALRSDSSLFLTGTAAYLAPEVASGVQPPTVASDLYALGCLLYELFTGRPPFVGAAELETLYLHASALWPDPSRWNRSLYPGDLRVLSRLLAKQPHHRYPSVDEALRDLEEAEQRPTEEPPWSWDSLAEEENRAAATADRTLRKNRRHVYLLGGSFLLLALLSLLLFWNGCRTAP
jgi:serine/threonine protein kinase